MKGKRRSRGILYIFGSRISLYLLVRPIARETEEIGTDYFLRWTLPLDEKGQGVTVYSGAEVARGIAFAVGCIFRMYPPSASCKGGYDYI